MKNHSLYNLVVVAAMALAVSGTFTSVYARGRAGAAARQVNRGGGSVQRGSTWTNAQGKTGSHTYQRTVDPVTKTATVNASTTLPDGRTASRDLVSVKTDTGRQTTGQVTGFNGRTATVDSTMTRTPDGRTEHTTLTGADGRVATRDSTIVRTGSGFTRDTVVTGLGGKTVTTDVNVTRHDGTVTRDVTRTGPNGGSVTKTQSATRTVALPPGN